MCKELNSCPVLYILAYPRGCTLCGSHWHTTPHCPMRGCKWVYVSALPHYQ